MRGDETIREVIGTLGNAEEYVRRVLGNMASFRRRKIDPVVKLGATGEGISPHYRIEPAPTGEGLESEMADFGDYLEYVKAFNGRSHKELSWTAFQIQGENWCSRAMTFSEVQMLLGEMRGRS